MWLSMGIYIIKKLSEGFFPTLWVTKVRAAHQGRNCDFVVTFSSGFISSKPPLEETIPDINCIVHEHFFIEKECLCSLTQLNGENFI